MQTTLGFLLGNLAMFLTLHLAGVVPTAPPMLPVDVWEYLMRTPDVTVVKIGKPLLPDPYAVDGMACLSTRLGLVCGAAE